ncbi:spindle assembly abnormal protein 6 homolog isoform X2 [Dysidea avara]|uniref:spindle assembly abnormal protein 6 homolog isoform X2 n=1 Tax=Dysidea avara TaxID=196820 RepID=UPI00332FA8F5
MEVLFEKELPLIFRVGEREDSHVRVRLSITLNTPPTPVTKKELVVRVTDENDPFFVYSLGIGDDDFQGLKSQQGLLVDFAAFPQKFIDLLELCLAESGKDRPKFLLYLVTSTSDRNHALLNIIEANAFKHLTHLSLKLLQPNDTALKKYLGECLIQMKEINSALEAQLATVKADLSMQLKKAQISLAERTDEVTRLKTEWSSHSATMSNQHMQELSSERDKNTKTQCELRQKCEEEKREMTQAHTQLVRQLENKVSELELANKELTENKYKSEALIHELTSKLRAIEEECGHHKSELQQIRRVNASLDSQSHESDKSISQLKTTVSILEQEIKDKEQVISRTTELLNSANQNKQQQESLLQQKNKQVSVLDATVKSASKEVKKGNEIIQKLQAELRSLKGKMKLKNMVTTEQEKLITQKDSCLEKQNQELQQLQSTLTDKEREVKKLTETVDVTKQKLEECREVLKTNENVINWLNKELNEHRLQQPLISSSNQFLINRPPTMTTANSYKFTSTPDGPVPRQPLHSMTTLPQNSQVMFKRTGLVGGAVPTPSPLAVSAAQYIKTSNSSTAQLTTPTFAPPTSTKLSSDKENKPRPPLLDPKYLTADVPIKSQQWQGSVTPNITTTLKYSPVTLSGGVTKGGAPPKLMSAYFPNSTQ